MAFVCRRGLPPPRQIEGERKTTIGRRQGGVRATSRLTGGGSIERQKRFGRCACANCWQPYVRNYTPHDNSQYNSLRFEEVWLHKQTLAAGAWGHWPLLTKPVLTAANSSIPSETYRSPARSGACADRHAATRRRTGRS